METQKIVNLLNDSKKLNSKFVTRICNKNLMTKMMENIV